MLTNKMILLTLKKSYSAWNTSGASTSILQRVLQERRYNKNTCFLAPWRFAPIF